MKIFFILWIIVFSLACSEKETSQSQKIRIISLAPSITEVLFALDLGEEVVAVTDYCSYPEKAKEKESIGGLLNPNLEKITALKPDFLIGTESYSDLSNKLVGKDFNIVLLPEKTVKDVYVTIDSLGRLFSRQKLADSLVTAIKDSINLYKLNQLENPPSAILVIGRSANDTRNISITSTGAFINEIWEITGGKNAFADLGSSFAQLNREALLAKNPELIIEFKSNKNWTLNMDKANKKEWQDLKISAVKNNQIYVIAGNDFLIPGPRMYLLAKRYKHILDRYYSQE